MPKRFSLFGGLACYYARGGWHDYRGSFDTIDEAKRAATCFRDSQLPAEYDLEDDDLHPLEWWHVIDSETQKMVLGTRDQPHGAESLPLEIYRP